MHFKAQPTPQGMRTLCRLAGTGAGPFTEPSSGQETIAGACIELRSLLVLASPVVQSHFNPLVERDDPISPAMAS